MCLNTTEMLSKYQRKKYHTTFQDTIESLYKISEKCCQNVTEPLAKYHSKQKINENFIRISEQLCKIIIKMPSKYHGDFGKYHRNIVKIS